MSDHRNRDPKLTPTSEPPPDIDAVSYFERAAAAEQDTITRKSQKHPNRYRLVSQLDRRIIRVILKYAKGRHNKCSRKHCKNPVNLTDALKHLKACEACRDKGAIKSMECRYKGKDIQTALQVRCHWLYTLTVY